MQILNCVPILTCFEYFNRKQELSMWMLTVEEGKVIQCHHVWESCTLLHIHVHGTI